MKHAVAAITFAAAIIFAATAQARTDHNHGAHGPQHGMPALTLKGSGGWGMNDAYAKQWDPATVETIKGTVLSVIHLMPGKKSAHGLQIKVDTGKEQILVHLGPMWFLENQDYGIQEGDAVEATGSRVTYNDRSAIIAKSIAANGMTLVLRDDNGVPRWNAWRKR